TPNSVKAVLEYTAVGIHNDTGLEYDRLRKGAGSLNTKGAIDLARAIDTSSDSGSWWLDWTPSPWTKIDGDTLTWNQAIIWGSTTGLTPQNAAWKDLSQSTGSAAKSAGQ